MKYVEPIKSLKTIKAMEKSLSGRDKLLFKMGMAWQIMKNISLKFGLKNIGTHTFRKTFGYHFLKQTNDIAYIQKLYGHASVQETLRYIGYDEKLMIKKCKGFHIS